MDFAFYVFIFTGINEEHMYGNYIRDSTSVQPLANL